MRNVLRAISFAGVLAIAASGQAADKRIGEIEFFGYGNIDVHNVRKALPAKEGDPFPGELKESAAMLAGISRAVKQRIGRSPSDVSPVCCDERGNGIIFIGLGGREIRYNPEPKGTAQLPPEALNLYQNFTAAVARAVQKGDAEEEHSKGYALATNDPALRAAELAMHDYAVNHAALIEQVLSSSAADAQRIAAAELLGFAPESRSQIDALVRATRDSNETVRNNAIRALMVQADSGAALAKQLPATEFIDLLCSGTWTDVNKASSLLVYLTRRRDPKLLAELKSRALDRLLEIARWRTGHADAGRMILGRIAGIDEARLTKLVESGDVNAIIAAAQSTR